MRLETPDSDREPASCPSPDETGIGVSDSTQTFKDCRMLHVEENEDDAFLFQRALDQLGFAGSYERVESTETALARLSQPPAPNVVIADGYQAGGIGTLHRMREALRNERVPIIVYSGDADKHAMDEALHNGATAFLLKKSFFEESLIAVQRILAECGVLNGDLL